MKNRRPKVRQNSKNRKNSYKNGNWNNKKSNNYYNKNSKPKCRIYKINKSRLTAILIPKGIWANSKAKNKNSPNNNSQKYQNMNALKKILVLSLMITLSRLTWIWKKKNKVILKILLDSPLKDTIFLWILISWKITII